MPHDIPLRQEFRIRRPFKAMLASLLAATLAGCGTPRGLLTTVGPDYQPPPVNAPSRWQGPLPHGGSLAELRNWWARFNDPLLLQLLDAAQSESPTLALAAARIEHARAQAVASGAQALPAVGVSAGITRGATNFGQTLVLNTQQQAGLQSSWEIDLFGGLARQREAASAQLAADRAAWHEARVAVAVEVAGAYLQYRDCEAQRALAESDLRSRQTSAELAAIAGRAGLQAPTEVTLAQASVAEGQVALNQRQELCERALLALVALTGLEHEALRARLQAPEFTARVPEPPPVPVVSVPAKVLAQRPDIAAAERELAAASANIGAAEAQRYPSLSLSGNIAPTRITPGGAPALNLTPWSIGPSLTLPLFDGGRRAAQADVARAQYQAAASVYRAKARGAVREVEEALLRLASTEARSASARSAAQGYRASLEAAQTRQRAGLASMVETEQLRRATLATESGLQSLALERAHAWLALYRAIGGGWDADPAPPVAAAESTRSAQ